MSYEEEDTCRLALRDAPHPTGAAALARPERARSCLV
jgi:hypothetical protein